MRGPVRRHFRQVVITVNGPGEIAAWLTPLTHALKVRDPSLHIAVALLPCVFSSGSECTVVERLTTVDAVCPTAKSYDIILRNRMPSGFMCDAQTLVFHLGGEVLLTHLIAWRLGARSFAHAERVLPWQGRFDRVFFSGLNPLPDKYANAPDAAIGDLMVDGARLRRAKAAGALRRDRRTLIGLFPGSRTYMVEHFLPYLAVLADEMGTDRPELDWAMARSDFVSLEFLQDFPELYADRDWRAHRVRYDGGGPAMVTEKGTCIRVLGTAEVLTQADFAVSLPGTNTAEMAASGLPMVVLLPTYMTEVVPLPGLAGHVKRLPIIGHWLHGLAARRALGRNRFLALPNRRAGRRIVPEIVGRMDQRQVAAVLGELLDGDHAALRAELQAAMGPPGAADHLADAVMDYFAGRTGPNC